ncbi:hypothetical protein BaRGS_00032012 [Batillaria attramentaria]|uniref:C-type lectin domain-containing protein n=1 Tax=Batillaria attramentaria TaxID=370345 RepID=A0ABD0JNS6_9CAEN
MKPGTRELSFSGLIFLMLFCSALSPVSTSSGQGAAYEKETDSSGKTGRFQDLLAAVSLGRKTAVPKKDATDAGTQRQLPGAGAANSPPQTLQTRSEHPGEDTEAISGKLESERHARSVPTKAPTNANNALLDSGGVCRKVPLQNRLTEGEGLLEWAGDGVNFNSSWLIEVGSSGSYGVVLQFHEVRLSWGLHGNGENVPVGLQDGMDDTLSVYTHGGPDATLVKTLRQATGHLPVAPLLVPSNQVCIHVVTHERIPQKDNKNTETPGKRPKFSLTYTAQLLETLPPVVSGGRYDCSPPYVVPQALRCDMVEQCVGGEDEKDFNCTYWDDECKDRISGTYDCLKFIFAEKPISWDEAYTACRTHQSLLLEIIDTVTKQLVNNITALSGQDDVVASFKREGPNPTIQKRRFQWLQGVDSLYTANLLQGSRLAIYGEPASG